MSICTCTPKQKESGRYSKRCTAHNGYLPSAHAERKRPVTKSAKLLAKTLAEKLAKEALRALGEEDLLYAHAGGVFARQDAYKRLAEFFERYAVGLS